MVNYSMFRLAILLTLLSLPGQIHARVGSTQFSTLVRATDLIVLGKVVDITTVKGFKIARVKVIETYKGTKVDELFFLAQPTWTCDISEAVKGETTLLFLTTYTNQRQGLDKFLSPPLPLREELKQAGVGTAMFLIVDSGRGRMPLRTIRGQQYATLWVDDVRLPATLHTIAGPNPKYSFIRSVRLNELTALLESSLLSMVSSGQRR